MATVKRYVRRRRHGFSAAEKLKGIEAALESSKTPEQFKPSLRKRSKQLRRMLGR